MILNLDLTPEKITSKNTFFHTDLFQDLEIQDILDLVHILIHEMKSRIQEYSTTILIDLINFEIHMYHPTEMANALTPTSWFYSLYTNASPHQNQLDYPSRLGNSFLLDIGASICVLNYPTYVIIAKL